MAGDVVRPWIFVPIKCLRAGTEPETGGAETPKTMELVLDTYDWAGHKRVYRVGQVLNRLE